MASYTFHKADSRGYANHGWLKTYHTFSFAGYMDPQRVHFGALRVLNDDYIAAGMGFGTHPHDNMEIVTIPLAGDLEHKDSMGHTEVIRQGDVQIMSAGTGITHSEYNHNKDKPVELLQIWVFPRERNIQPRYDQRSYDRGEMKNKLLEVVSPDDKDAMWINQDARFLLGGLDAGTALPYTIKKPGNGVYVFLIEGELLADEKQLSKRDGLGVWNTNSIQLKATQPSFVLLIEVPMEF